MVRMQRMILGSRLIYTRRAVRRALTTATEVARRPLLVVNHIYLRVIRVIRGQILFLLFLAQFLESGIGAQRIPDRIKL
jgi:hypothetical protein